MCSGLVKDATAASLDHRPRCCVLDLAALSCFGRNVIIFSRCRRQWKAHGSWRSVPAAAPAHSCRGPCRAALEERHARPRPQRATLSSRPHHRPSRLSYRSTSKHPNKRKVHCHSRQCALNRRLLLAIRIAHKHGVMVPSKAVDMTYPLLSRDMFNPPSPHAYAQPRPSGRVTSDDCDGQDHPPNTPTAHPCDPERRLQRMVSRASNRHTSHSIWLP